MIGDQVHVPVHVVHPNHTNFLLTAGLLPLIMGFPITIANFYYLVLLPPAIYQCVLVFRNHIIPGVKHLFNRGEDSS